MESLRKIPVALVWVIAVALFLRLGGLWWVATHGGAEAFVYGDAVGYLSLADHIQKGYGFVREFEGVLLPEMFRTPGLPFLLSLFFTTGGFSVLGYAVFLSVLSGVLIPFFTWSLGRDTLGAPAGLFAAALLAVEPHFVFFSWFPQTEMPFIVLMLAGAALLARGIRRGSVTLSVSAGFLFGAASLVRPGGFPVIVAALLAVCGFFIFRKWQYQLLLAAMAALMLAVAPWVIHMKQTSGVYAMSAAGWRNVYTDYVASIRALENGTAFHDEKRNLKENAPTLGVPPAGIDDPAYGPILRKAALSEIMQHKATALKLEAAILLSFFTNDGYYYAFKRVGIIRSDTSHVSATYTLLTKGMSGIGEIINELKSQWFLPVFGRLFLLIVTVLAAIGVFRAAHTSRFLFAGIILLFALSSSAIGLGVESRLRLPAEPFLFLLAGATFIKKRHNEI